MVVLLFLLVIILNSSYTTARLLQFSSWQLCQMKWPACRHKCNSMVYPVEGDHSLYLLHFLYQKGWGEDLETCHWENHEHKNTSCWTYLKTKMNVFSVNIQNVINANLDPKFLSADVIHFLMNFFSSLSCPWKSDWLLFCNLWLLWSCMSHTIWFHLINH